MRTVILASLLLAVTSATSFAATPLINARQNAQQHRIFKGVSRTRLELQRNPEAAEGPGARAEPGEPGQGQRCRHTARARPHPRRAKYPERAHLPEEA